MARRGNPARLVIALSVAAVLAVFLLYTSLAGGGTPSLRPSTLAGHDGKVSLTGRVLKPVTGDAHGAGLRFRLRDVKGTATVASSTRASCPTSSVPAATSSSTAASRTASSSPSRARW